MCITAAFKSGMSHISQLLCNSLIAAVVFCLTAESLAGAANPIQIQARVSKVTTDHIVSTIGLSNRGKTAIRTAVLDNWAPVLLTDAGEAESGGDFRDATWPAKLKDFPVILPQKTYEFDLILSLVRSDEGVEFTVPDRFGGVYVGHLVKDASQAWISFLPLDPYIDEPVDRLKIDPKSLVQPKGPTAWLPISAEIWTKIPPGQWSVRR